MRQPRYLRPLRFAALGAVVINGLFPVVWIFATSLKSEVELVRRPITWWPEQASFESYARAFSEQPLWRFLGNSLAIAALSAVLAVAVAAAAAYALARLPVPRRGLVLTGLVAVAMVPSVALVGPLFTQFRGLGLLNTWLALVLPNAVLSLPVCTLVLVAFFRSIPIEFEEAALVAGCSRLGAFWRVTLPEAVPGLATAALLAFVNAWDEFLLALSLNAAPGGRTLPVGILLYQGEYTFPWPVISAALVVGIVPLALVIFVFQERVVGGLTSGGLKG